VVLPPGREEEDRGDGPTEKRKKKQRFHQGKNIKETALKNLRYKKAKPSPEQGIETNGQEGKRKCTKIEAEEGGTKKRPRATVGGGGGNDWWGGTGGRGKKIEPGYH